MEELNVEALHIMNEYPLIAPYPNYKAWEGFIQVKNHDVHLEISTPNYPSLKDIRVQCPSDFYPALIPLVDNFEESSLLNVLRSITHALKSYSIFPPESVDINTHKLQTLVEVLTELDVVGSDNIVDLDIEELTVTLSYEDTTGNSHKIKTKFDIDYPKSGVQIKTVDLPEETIEILSGFKTFRQLYTNFTEKIEELLPFWEITSDLDQQCWVIDPEKPSNKHTYRRIFLSTDLSISVIFNIQRLSEMPEIKFFGCISTVESQRAAFMSKLESQGWDLTESVAENLKKLLSIDEFPKKPSSSENSPFDPLECLICASNGLEQGAPAQKWCNNDKCPSIYHRYCLYKWFDGLQTAKQYWDYICGPCPHCKVKIWCPIKEDVPNKS